MALSRSKKIRSRLLILFARLLRIPVAIHQSFFSVYPSNLTDDSAISLRADHTPSETG
jgi:hypothetical protein